MLNIELQDNMSGVNPMLLMLTIDSQVFNYGDFDYSEPVLTFDCAANGLNFEPGDSVSVQLSACDSPTPPESLYCAPNCELSEWFFYVFEEFDCDAVPIPFTPDEPNNNYVQFEYPGLAIEAATIHIFNVRNVEVAKIEVPGSGDARNQARWFGEDDKGNPQKQGVYLYVIEVDDEIVCNGSIVLAR
jgi:hypothetical protein